VAAQGADALGAHGVALVGHRAGADLFASERLLALVERLQKPDVLRELVGALRDAAEHRKHAAVQLSRVGLPADRVDRLQPHLFGDALFQLQHLLAIAVEKRQEAGLGAGGALGAQQLHRAQRVVEVLHIHQEVLHPKGCALAHRHRLRGLQVGEAQRGQVLVPEREGAKAAKRLHQLAADQLERVP